MVFFATQDGVDDPVGIETIGNVYLPDSHTMCKISQFFGVHYSTVGRAVKNYGKWNAPFKT